MILTCTEGGLFATQSCPVAPAYGGGALAGRLRLGRNGGIGAGRRTADGGVGTEHVSERVDWGEGGVCCGGGGYVGGR